MKSILAFGDSNTWGYVPGTKTHERFPYEKRWTGILETRLSDCRIIEEGLCGRTTVFEDALRPGRRGLDSLPRILETEQPLDAAIIMLGTNDCKRLFGANEYIIGKGMERCLDELVRFVPAEKILLISPIHLGDDVWHPEKDPEFCEESVRVSRTLKDVYANIAQRWGVNFLAASDYAKADAADDEHLNEEGHLQLADAIYRGISQIIWG